MFDLTQWDSNGSWQSLLCPRQGITLHGRLLVNALGLALHCQHHGIPLLEVLDFAAAPVALGIAFGRVGCLLNTCCIGSIIPQRTSPGMMTHFNIGLESSAIWPPANSFDGFVTNILTPVTSTAICCVQHKCVPLSAIC